MDRRQVRDLEALEQQIIRVQQSTGTRFPGFIRVHNWLRMHNKLYYAWHTTMLANVAHISILTFALFVVGLVLIALVLVAIAWFLYVNFDTLRAIFASINNAWS